MDNTHLLIQSSDLREVKSLLNQILNRPKEDLSQKLYTVKEASLLFKVTELTVRNKIKAGEIKAFKIGDSVRIKHEEIFNSLQEVKSIKYKRKA